MSSGDGAKAFDGVQAIEAELIQRNREIAKIRDQLRKRENEVIDWKARNDDLVVKVAELDAESTKHKTRAIEAEDALEKAEADIKCRGASGDVQAALARCVVLEQQAARLEGQCRVEADSRAAAEELAQIATETQIKIVNEERQRMAAAESARTAAEAEALQHRTRAEELDAILRKVEREKADERAQSATLSCRVAQLEAQLQSARANISKELTATIADEQAKSQQKFIEETQRDAEMHRKDRLRLQEQVEEKTLAAEAANRKVENLNRQLQMEKTEVDLMKEQLREVEVVRDVADQEKTKLIQTVNGLKRQVDESKALLEAQKSLKMDMMAREQDLKQKLAEKDLKILEIEKTPAAPVVDEVKVVEMQQKVVQAEANAKKAQLEAMKYKASMRELHEGLAMVTEEMLTRDVESCNEITRLRMQLDETRRARSIEMRAMIQKMILPVEDRESPARGGYAGDGVSPIRASPRGVDNLMHTSFT